MREPLPFDRLKPKQRIALLAVLCGHDEARTADEANVSTRTIRRWRKLPDFEEALQAARVDFYSACRSQVVAAHAEAFEALRVKAGYCSTPGETVRSSMFLIDYLARPEMAKVLVQREPKINRFNTLVQFSPGKSGQIRPSDTNSRPISANLDFPSDDAG
jgi:hypothetical protein